MSAAPIVLPGTRDDAVMLIHGLTGAPAEMKPLARALNRQGFTVHVPLLPGHGADKRTLLRTGWRDWLAGCEAAFDCIAADHATVHVGGVCAGASLAVLLAARRQVASLVTYSMTFRYDGWAMPLITRGAPLLYLIGSLPLIRSIGFAERHPFGIKDDRLRRMIQRQLGEPSNGMLDEFPIGACSELFRMGGQVRRDAARVTAPALLFHATRDDMADAGNSRLLQARLGGPTRLEMLDDSFHLVHLDREAGRVASLTASHCDAASRMRAPAYA